jgi:hypothetical protein
MYKFVSNTLLFLYHIGNLVFTGYVLSKLWLWFISPVMGVVPLTIPQAIGWGLIFTAISYRFSPRKAETDSDEDFNRENWALAITRTGVMAFMLGIGAIVQLFT